MHTAKPTLFLGSSSEAKSVAKVLAKGLSAGASVDPWWTSHSFRLSHSTLSGLLNAGRGYDFGLFVLAPDDKLESRGVRQHSARDNVMFEFGLFLGALGPERVFAVIVHRGRKKVRVPADLLGIDLGQLQVKPDGTAVRASLDKVLERIQRTMSEQGRKHGQIRLSKSWDFESKGRAFYLLIEEAQIKSHESMLRGASLVLAVRVEDDGIDMWTDRKVTFSAPREMEPPLPTRMKISAPVPARAKAGIIFGRLFLVPAGVSLQGVKVMADLRSRGCQLLDTRGKEL